MPTPRTRWSGWRPSILCRPPSGHPWSLPRGATCMRGRPTARPRTCLSKAAYGATGTTTTATLKRLFALSGNRCTFPKCASPLIHEGVVTGEVCHIKAASPEGHRYDPRQPNKERNSFENLVLMCQPHHTIIDNDYESYTVERLHKIKEQHEQSHSSEPPSESAELFAAAILGAGVYGDVTNASNVTIYRGAESSPTSGHPHLEIGFAANFLVSLHQTTELAPIVGGRDGVFLAKEDSISIRTDNRGEKSARNLIWSYAFPPGVAVWSGPGYDGTLHYLRHALAIQPNPDRGSSGPTQPWFRNDSYLSDRGAEGW